MTKQCNIRFARELGRRFEEHNITTFSEHPGLVATALGASRSDTWTGWAERAGVKAFWAAGKPIGAICHGPWLLVEADVVKGRKITSYHSIKTDVVNAGGEWEDSECVCDNGLVTSRNPDDLPAFSAKMIEEIAEGRHDLSAA